MERCPKNMNHGNDALHYITSPRVIIIESFETNRHAIDNTSTGFS